MSGSAASHRVTDLLVRWRSLDSDALNPFIPVVCAELRKLARRYLCRERDEHTWQIAALAHEAYVSFTGKDSLDWLRREISRTSVA
jgi:hypothetical protein